MLRVKDNQGSKFDTGKLDWYVLPLEILEPLVEVMKAGEKKYGTFLEKLHKDTSLLESEI